MVSEVESENTLVQTSLGSSVRVTSPRHINDVISSLAYSLGSSPNNLTIGSVRIIKQMDYNNK